MTGPPDDDLPESIETILPLFVGRFAPRDTVFYCTFSQLPQSKPVLIHVPFGWGPVIDPVDGVLITSHVRTDCPRIGPAAVLQAARDGRYGFRLADETEGA